MSETSHIPSLEISLQATARGFESHPLRHKNKLSPFGGSLFFIRGDSNPERVSAVKKTVRWTVFRREVRRSYASRTDDANEMQRHHPTRCTIKRHTHILGVPSYIVGIRSPFCGVCQWILTL